jgi:tetratricopeptide (TPR) repeat protein
MTRLAARLPLAAVLALAALPAAMFGCGKGASPSARVAEVVGEAPPRILVANADSALAAGDAEGARRLLLRAEKLAPDSAFVYLGLGRLQTALRRYKDAKESFERAASLDRGSPEPAFWLGKAYQQSGDLAAAAQAFTLALRLDPNHRGAAAALGPILGARYEAAGIPGDYALLRERSTLTRGELAVVLAVELGADPDRVAWRSDAASPQGEEFEGAWAGRWARAAASREWITPFADQKYHLDDPVTRAALALTIASVERRWGPATGTGAAGAPQEPGTIAFPDLGPRHYLYRAATRATLAGLPVRGDDGRFEPWSSATGNDVLLAIRGMARRLGAVPVVSSEQR